jgi:hypothetical protein
MRLSAAFRSADSQRIKSPPVPSPDRELVGILRPESLIAAILRRAEPIVVLAAAAGMGKSTLLRIFSNDNDVRLHTGLRSPDPPDRGATALWDIPLDGDPFPLTDFHLRSEGRLVIAKHPEQHLQGLERALASCAAVMIGDEALCLREEDLRRVLGATMAGEIIAKTGGWPILVNAFLADREPEAMKGSAIFWFAPPWRASLGEHLSRMEARGSSHPPFRAARSPDGLTVKNGRRVALDDRS